MESKQNKHIEDLACHVTLTLSRVSGDCADNFTVVSFLEAIEDQVISSALESETDQRSNQDVMEEGR